jgi:hypothetical protein
MVVFLRRCRVADLKDVAELPMITGPSGLIGIVLFYK